MHGLPQILRGLSSVALFLLLKVEATSTAHQVSVSPWELQVAGSSLLFESASLLGSSIRKVSLDLRKSYLFVTGTHRAQLSPLRSHRKKVTHFLVPVPYCLMLSPRSSSILSSHRPGMPGSFSCSSYIMVSNLIWGVAYYDYGELFMLFKLETKNNFPHFDCKRWNCCHMKAVIFVNVYFLSEHRGFWISWTFRSLPLLQI